MSDWIYQTKSVGYIRIAAENRIIILPTANIKYIQAMKDNNISVFLSVDNDYIELEFSSREQRDKVFNKVFELLGSPT